MEQELIVSPSLPQPPPSSGSDESMWSAFQNILTFISLAVFAGALHALWSIFVNYYVPGAKDNTFWNELSTFVINGAISALVVSGPFFIGLFLVTNLKYIKRPELKGSRLKKILNYITLIVTFIILLVRTITAITMALNESFSLNFILNVTVTFVICGAIFLYYLYEVRFEKRVSHHVTYIVWAVFISLLAVCTFGVSLKVRNSLKQQEKAQQDQMKQTAFKGPSPVISQKDHTTLLPDSSLFNGPEFNIVFNFPSKYRLLQHDDVTDSFGTPGNVAFTVSRVLNMNVNDYRPCAGNEATMSQIPVSCIFTATASGQGRYYQSMTIDGVAAKSFYVHKGSDNIHVVQTSGAVPLEFQMRLKEADDDATFNHILLTIKFTN